MFGLDNLLSRALSESEQPVLDLTPPCTRRRQESEREIRLLVGRRCLFPGSSRSAVHIAWSSLQVSRNCVEPSLESIVEPFHVLMPTGVSNSSKTHNDLLPAFYHSMIYTAPNTVPCCLLSPGHVLKLHTLDLKTNLSWSEMVGLPLISIHGSLWFLLWSGSSRYFFQF